MDNEKIRNRTLGQILDDTVQKFPNKNAIIYVGHEYRQTWSEFAAAVDRLGRSLMAMGVQPGEKIALWATNVPNWVALMFAAAKIGAILVSVNTNYRDSELEYLLRQSESENLFCIDGFLDYDYVAALYRIIPDLAEQKPGDIQSSLFPKLKRIVTITTGDKETPHRGIMALSDLLAHAEETPLAAYEERVRGVNPDDVVNMQYTSGTTGYPKGVMLTHKGIGYNGYCVGERAKITERDAVALPIPLFHCFGNVVGVMAFVSRGTTMVILESFSPERLMSAIEEERCTGVYGVPSMYISMLGHKRFDQYDFSSLRFGVMSGTICPEPLIRQAMEKLGIEYILIPYGMTECSPTITMTSFEDDDRRFRSAGKVLPDMEMELHDLETRKPVPFGTTGEICCRGYNVMKSYYNMPKETEASFEEGSWFRTGDLGVLDEDGYLYITGRIKDMVIRGGENIYPREIEEFLLKMDTVMDVQVLGIPSRRYGEELAAFIIPKEGCEVRSEDVREFCRGRVAWHKIPRYIAVVEDYPRTASGKIQKFKLREWAKDIFPHVK